MRYGLISDGVQDIKEYVLGASKMPYIEYTDGDWESYLPKYEAQADRFESFGCTLWGLQNQLEIFEKMLYGIEPNYDEWFNYPLIPINADGKAPQITYESVREHGLVPAKTLREPRTREEALDTDRISGSMRAKGQNWLLQHDFQHEWVWPTNRRPQNYLAVLKDAIKTSPIALSVTAWYEENGLYVDRGKRNNHWCVAYKIDDTGIYIFDTYNHSKKKLALNHNIEIAKRIWLNKKTRRASKRHVGILEAILNLLMNKRTLFDVAKARLGTDVTPRDTVKDEVACAETLTTLMREIYPETPIISGTYTLWEYLKQNPKWAEVEEPETGDIILSPTGTGQGIGHTGVVMENELIASNNSFGPNKGKLTKNYTLPLWRQKYVKLATYFFRRVI